MSTDVNCKYCQTPMMKEAHRQEDGAVARSLYCPTCFAEKEDGLWKPGPVRSGLNYWPQKEADIEDYQKALL